jgi:hypothetical protein
VKSEKFPWVSKASDNNHYHQALVGVASRLNRASSSLSKSSPIIKRLRFYTLASNCVKPVRTTHLTMLTYTFNYCYPICDNDDGELRKRNVAD